MADAPLPSFTARTDLVRANARQNWLDQRLDEIWWYKMRQAATKALYKHWQDLCRGTIIPDRNDLDPAEIGHLLRDVFILGADSNGIWRYRVAGTRMTGLAGHELRNETFESWWRHEDRKDATRLLNAAAHDALPSVLGLKGMGSDDNSYEIEGIILPLRHGGRNGLRMLGGFFPSQPAATAIGLRILDLGLLSMRTIDPSKPPVPSFGIEPDNLDLIMAKRTSFRLIEGGLGRSPQT